MVDRIRWDTVSYLPFYYIFFKFLLLTIFNVQAKVLAIKDILSNLAHSLNEVEYYVVQKPGKATKSSLGLKQYLV